MLRLAPFLPLLLAACNFATVEDTVPTPDATATAVALVQPPRAIRIGEGGPGFPACQWHGTVVSPDPNPGGLPVRAAPFAEADEVARLADGAQVIVCTRTLDQRWLGVIMPPTADDEAACGARGRIDRPRDYAGPCPSGWLAANAVRLRGA